MQLLLVRHGHPLSEREDPARPLSERGAQEVRKLASHLGARGVTVEAVWESGKTRATQTAEILAAGLAGGAEGLITKPGIKPNDPVEGVAEELSGRREDLMIVGHLPFLARLVSRLILGSNAPDIVAFQPAAAVCLRRDPFGDWTVAWMLAPSIL